MARRFKHVRRDIIVEWKDQNFYEHVINPMMKIPTGVVEDSPDWKEILPILDFYGKEIKNVDRYYDVWLLQDGGTSIINRGTPDKGVKILTTFSEYEDACEFQRLYVAFAKSKDILVTESGNPSAFLKKLLQIL